MNFTSIKKKKKKSIPDREIREYKSLKAGEETWRSVVLGTGAGGFDSRECGQEKVAARPRWYSGMWRASQTKKSAETQS